MEKKKKGKRKNEIPVDSLDLDQDLLSPSVQSPEESAESADSQVWPKPSAGSSIAPGSSPFPVRCGEAGQPHRAGELHVSL